MQRTLSPLSAHFDDLIEYIEIEFELLSRQEADQETFLAFLAAFGFSGFREEEGRIFAYIAGSDYSSGELESYMDMHGLREKVKSYRSETLPGQNWNEIWERNFPPVEISGKCYIRAPFHLPPKGVDYDLVISPKMSFGTAHHETTRMMLESMLLNEWDKGRVLDFGCGTGILAILAEKMGARHVIALDNDPWAWENAGENLLLNKCRNINVIGGEIGSLNEKPFNTIFANINLNILLQEMHNIGNSLVSSGLVFLSGFYLDDLPGLNEAASRQDLTLINKVTLNSWTVGVYRKGH